MFTYTILMLGVHQHAAASARTVADLEDQLGKTIAPKVKPTEDRLSEVNGDLKAMHGTLEQFEDTIDKRINTDVMLIFENLGDQPEGPW